MAFSSRRGFLTLMGGTILIAGCSNLGSRGVSIGADDYTTSALPLVNKIRKDRDLASLSPQSQARKAAAEQAVRMAKAEKMTHLIGAGDSFLSRMKRNDVPLPASENIASGQNSVEDAVEAWINSKRHLVNMIGDYRGLGVAVARSSTSRTYWAMVLCA